MASPTSPHTFADRYTIEGVLGEGGFATVYAARDDAGRRVALKVLKFNTLPSDPTLIARFEREVQALAKLTHPATVRLYNFGKWNNQHFMVFEFVPGHDLREVLKRVGALDREVATRIPATDTIMRFIETTRLRQSER